MAYDSRFDTEAHQMMVGAVMQTLIHELIVRRETHDASKLEEPEKSMYDTFRPRLKELAVDSPEYKESLAAMGEGLKHHYAANRHHPEHFEYGVDGMNLVDVIEMVCDWYVSARAGRRPFNAEYIRTRFGISSQLMNIINNTMAAILASMPQENP